MNDGSTALANLFAKRKVVINKIDLLGSSDFDMNRVKENAQNINANLKIFELSCRTGQGLEEWYKWIKGLAKKNGIS